MKEVSRMENKKPDRRTARTKKMIYNALSELLTEKELHKITVQEVVDKANLSRGTFYKHFFDVFDVYDSMAEIILVEVGIALVEVASKDTKTFFTGITDYLSHNPSISRMIIAGKLKEQLTKLFEGLFRQIQSEKLGISINDTALSYVNSYRANGFVAILTKWIQSNFKEPADEIVKHLTKLDTYIENYMTK